MPAADEGAVVGIDLGTTYSVAAIVEKGRPRVISDTGGSYTIPSIVAIDDKGNRLIGQAAKRQSMTNPVNTVFGAKRLVGRDISSRIVDEIQEHVKYRIEEGRDSDVQIRLRNDRYAVEEIQALLLDHIRNTAQDMLGREITKAVVTVPAYFNDRQRQAVREAGKVAQLEVLRIINEPTAAALAYGYGKGMHQRAVVFDLGGGTFDVSILELRNNTFEVRATGGNTFLGGVDFDNKLVEHLVKDFKAAHNLDLARDPMSHQRLKDACEQAKIDLSTMPSTRINIPFIAAGPEGPLALDLTVKREQFEEMIRPLVEETITVTARVLDESGWSKDQIDAVLLVGGSTRIPMVAQMVADFFGKQPSKNVHPDEAVALGAAIMADSIVNRDSDIQLLDVLPINIGIGLPNGRTVPLFERNSSVPNQKLKTFTTSKDNQDTLKIKVIQGDSEKVADCELIGDFIFRGIHPAPKGKARVEVIFSISNEGILSVTAHDPDTGVEQTGVLQVTSSTEHHFRQDLIQHRQPAILKETQKVITQAVVREKKLKTAEPAPAPGPAAPAPASKGSSGPSPAGKADTGPRTAVKTTTPPKPVKPPKPPKPGLFVRLQRWLKKS
jgi:molecular chaperone DnaK